jgi:cytidine deaminase
MDPESHSKEVTKIQVSIKSKHTLFVEIAFKAALNSSIEFRHGCVVITEDGEISIGWNTETSQSRRFSVKRTIHAEEAAMRRIPRSRLRGAKVYVVRVSRNREMSFSKPCKACECRLKKARVKVVYYS